MAGFWEGRRALVTGAGGFIGSHLVEGLAREGATVRALVHYNSRNDPGMLAAADPCLMERVEVVLGDITDPFQMQRLTEDCDSVFHLAALIGIPYSYGAPASYVATNVSGTLNLLEGARRGNVRRFVQISTSEVYGSAQRVPMDETHPLHPQSPYAASKVGADQMALSYHLSFGLPVVVVRPFNTYGPRQSARAVIPTIVSQLLAGGPVRLGSVETRRDFTFAPDTARGMRLAAETDAPIGQVVNLGTGRDVSISEVAELAARITGRELRIEADPNRVRPEKSEVDRLQSDPRKAADLLGWEAEVPLEDGLAAVVAWLEENAHRYDTDRYVV